MNLESIQDRMKAGNLTPHEAAELRARLSGEYSFVAGQLEQILARKPAWWNAHREHFKSDTACERSWEGTEDGINEVGLRLRMKRIDALRSGLKTLIEIAQGEARNLY